MTSTTDPTSIPRLYDLVSQIRDFVNVPRLRDSLFSDARSWNMLCSAMDAVNDTDLAIDAYLQIVDSSATKVNDFASEAGHAYLVCSGAMQALFVQSDSVKKLCQCLTVAYDESRYPKLTGVRLVRNATFGHPVDWRGKHSTQIIRRSLGMTDFEYLLFSDSHHFVVKSASVPQLVSDQRECLAEVLQEVVDALRDRERQHREEFRMIKLADIISPGLSDLLRDICEAPRQPQRTELATVALKVLQHYLAKVEQALRDRGVSRSTYDSVGDLYDDLEYAIEKLGAYFPSVTASQTPEFDERMAYMVACFVRERMERLQSVLRGIDEGYAEEP